jgi:hypothetical protein
MRTTENRKLSLQFITKAVCSLLNVKISELYKSFFESNQLNTYEKSAIQA